MTRLCGWSPAQLRCFTGNFSPYYCHRESGWWLQQWKHVRCSTLKTGGTSKYACKNERCCFRFFSDLFKWNRLETCFFKKKNEPKRGIICLHLFAHRNALLSVFIHLSIEEKQTYHSCARGLNLIY